MELEIFELDDGGSCITLTESEREVDIVATSKNIYRYFVIRSPNFRVAGVVENARGLVSLNKWLSGDEFTSEGLVLPEKDNNV